MYRSIGSINANADSIGGGDVKAAGGAASAGACANPKQHAWLRCVGVDAGSASLPARSGSAALQKTDHTEPGAPSRNDTAWASGNRTLSVMASRAQSSALA
jgi:hypothetical protein